MALKDHSGFKYIHGSMFPWQSKDKIFVPKILVDLLRSDVDLVKCMQGGEDMENLWIMFGNVKCLKN